MAKGPIRDHRPAVRYESGYGKPDVPVGYRGECSCGWVSDRWTDEREAMADAFAHRDAYQRWERTRFEQRLREELMAATAENRASMDQALDEIGGQLAAEHDTWRNQP